MLSPSTCTHSGDNEILIMVDMIQEALPVIEDKILNELQFIPIQFKHAPPSTPFICPSLTTYIPDLNPSCTRNSFELKADAMYPGTICETIEEAFALRTGDAYTFSLSTKPHAAHVISPMQTPAHIRYLGFSEYKNGRMQCYSILTSARVMS